MFYFPKLKMLLIALFAVAGYTTQAWARYAILISEVFIGQFREKGLYSVRRVNMRINI